MHNRPLTTFRMNTYEKQGRGWPVIVNQESEKDSCPERAQRDRARAGGALSGQDDSKAASGRRTPRGGRPLPEFFVRSFFGRGFASWLAFEAGGGVFQLFSGAGGPGVRFGGIKQIRDTMWAVVLRSGLVTPVQLEMWRARGT